jgi:hypothetical protein
MSRFFTSFCTVLLIVVFTPSTTNADPIVITGGFVFVQDMRGPAYSLVGSNFGITGGAGDEGNTGPARCFPACRGGDVIPVSSTYLGTSLGLGSAFVNGSFFHNIRILGVFTFTGDPFVVPNATSAVSITAPFLFSGAIVGCSLSDSDCRTPVFSTQLVGSGIATIELSALVDPEGRVLFDFDSVNYAFNVPEPMSILLLASGLAALSATKLKRRR